MSIVTNMPPGSLPGIKALRQLRQSSQQASSRSATFLSPPKVGVPATILFFKHNSRDVASTCGFRDQDATHDGVVPAFLFQSGSSSRLSPTWVPRLTSRRSFRVRHLTSAAGSILLTCRWKSSRYCLPRAGRAAPPLRCTKANEFVISFEQLRGQALRRMEVI